MNNSCPHCKNLGTDCPVHGEDRVTFRMKANYGNSGTNASTDTPATAPDPAP